ncbi:MAG: hypothetical protein HQL75_08545 [Magnetococcales bacterium]|nr:hypothetical protein [Magnetococcales bacterium]
MRQHNGRFPAGQFIGCQRFVKLQAETLVGWMEDRLATKLKLEHVWADLKRDIELIRAESQRDIKELEQRMVIKLRSLMFVAVDAMAALVKPL